MHRRALGAALVYVLLALAPVSGVPFVRFPAFRFPVPDGPTVVPLFRAAGEPADIRDYGGFTLDPAAVDVEHRGYASSVEHLFHEQRSWIAGHPGEAGPVPVEIGVRILSVEGGRLIEAVRIDAVGTATPR